MNFDAAGWNPVLNKFVEIKNEYIKRYNHISYDYVEGYTDESITCLEAWVSKLNKDFSCDRYKEYENMLRCIELNQYKNMLLFRYARYSNVYDGEIEASGGDLWDRYNGFYRECRSIVIDIENDCIILSPFKKFFNINELEETSLSNIQRRIDNAKTIEFSDKLDGSMQSARWYGDKIIMAGSQAINPNNSWRLEDGYRMINSLPGYRKMLMEHPDCTFIFEYISLKDAHVVRYKKEQEGLHLIGIRNVNSGEESDYHEVVSIANEYHIPTTEIINKTLEQAMNELDDKTSDIAEGFVINIDGYKVKLKYNDYVHIHRALSKLSSINLIIRSIADDQYDDLLSKLPAAYHESVQKIAAIVIKYIDDMEKKIKEYYKEAPKNNKKEFMNYVTQHVPKKYQHFCRDLYIGRKINVLKSGSKESPHYKKLNEMGIDDYSKLFMEDIV